MTLVEVADAEDVVLAWLKTLTLPDNPGRFLQPQGNPLPRIQLSQVAAPEQNDDFGTARISIQVYAGNRPQAKAIKLALKGELESLKYTGAVATSQGVLKAAEIANDIWYPDPVSNTPRYIVDARVVVSPLGG